jgi:hypothetical protein
MDTNIISALIGVAGTIIVFFLGQVPWNSISSSILRKQQNIPNIMGSTWKATWYEDNDKVYVEDRIEFNKWTKQNKFVGSGDMTENLDGKPDRFIYPIEGEITAARKVVLIYRAEKFPTESLIGTACMELNESASELKGWWVGQRKIKNDKGETEWKLLPGKVKMVLLRSRQ